MYSQTKSGQKQILIHIVHSIRNSIESKYLLTFTVVAIAVRLPYADTVDFQLSFNKAPTTINKQMKLNIIICDTFNSFCHYEYMPGQIYYKNTVSYQLASFSFLRNVYVWTEKK